MPIDVMTQVFYDGLDSVPWIANLLPVVRPVAPYAAALILLRWYFSGAKNPHERVMNSRVVMGGTSGIGESLVTSLASRGAQIILLVKDTSDPFLIDRIQFLRDHTNNQLIYAEQCDLASLHSIRLFATKWIDNAPPRRLDMILLCAAVSPAPLAPQQHTPDGVDAVWGINYLANFHLLTLLAPAIRNQPPHRDVRIIAATCGSYMLSPPLTEHLPDPGFAARGGGFPTRAPWRATGAAKLALMAFLGEFNRRLHTYERKDGEPVNARVMIVDPGFARTPGTRRFLTLGSLWGLLVYFLTWPLWWMVLKSAGQAGQSFLWAAMSPEGAEGEGGGLVRECRVVEGRRGELGDAEVARGLWEASEREIEVVEKRAAVERKKRQLEEERVAKEEAKKGKGKGSGTGKAKGTRAGVKIEEIVDEEEGGAGEVKSSGADKKASPPSSAENSKPATRSRTKKG